MSIESLMIHTCSITRETIATTDPYGDPVTATAVSVYSGRCRLVEKTERVTSGATAATYVITRYVLLLPATAAVEERDLVHSITDESGVAIGASYRIIASRARRGKMLHHYSVDLERVS